MKSDPEVKRSRRMLLLLAAVFALPLAAAFWLYYGSSWRPAASTAHGTLLQPPRPLPALALQRATGVGIDATAVDIDATGVANDGASAAMSVPQAVAFKDRWSLVVIAAGDCDADCRHMLIFSRQEQRMLGRLGTRLQRVWLAAGDCCDWRYLAAEQSDLLVVRADAPLLSPLLAAFPETGRKHTIYVVDPRGNLVLSYRTDQPPNGLRDDLKKLLDLSHIG